MAWLPLARSSLSGLISQTFPFTTIAFSEPPDDELVAELLQYAKERLPLARRLDRLKKKFGYIIGHVYITFESLTRLLTFRLPLSVPRSSSS